MVRMTKKLISNEVRMTNTIYNVVRMTNSIYNVVRMTNSIYNVQCSKDDKTFNLKQFTIWFEMKKLSS